MKFSLTVLVWWRIIARGSTKLHIILQKTFVDSSCYVSEILEKELNPAFSRAATSNDLTVRQNCFRAIVIGGFIRTVLFCTHTKPRITKLKNNVGYYILKEDWPQNSPDLSPIENVWSIMAADATSPDSQTLTAFKRRLRKSWRSIFDHCVKSHRFDA